MELGRLWIRISVPAVIAHAPDIFAVWIIVPAESGGRSLAVAKVIASLLIPIHPMKEERIALGRGSNCQGIRPGQQGAVRVQKMRWAEVVVIVTLQDIALAVGQGHGIAQVVSEVMEDFSCRIERKQDFIADLRGC